MTDILADGMFDVGVDMFSDDIEIIAMDAPAIILEFVVEIAYAGDVLTDVLTVLISDVVTVIEVDMLTDENVIGLTVAMNRL